MAIATISMSWWCKRAFDSGVLELGKVLKDTGFEGDTHD